MRVGEHEWARMSERWWVTDTTRNERIKQLVKNFSCGIFLQWCDNGHGSFRALCCVCAMCKDTYREWTRNPSINRVLCIHTHTHTYMRIKIHIVNKVLHLKCSMCVCVSMCACVCVCRSWFLGFFTIVIVVVVVVVVLIVFSPKKSTVYTNIPRPEKTHWKTVQFFSYTHTHLCKYNMMWSTMY